MNAFTGNINTNTINWISPGVYVNEITHTQYEPQSLEEWWMMFLSKKFPESYSWGYGIYNNPINTISLNTGTNSINFTVSFSMDFAEPQSLEELWRIFLSKRGLSYE